MPVLQRSITGTRGSTPGSIGPIQGPIGFFYIKWAKNELCSCRPYPTPHTTTIGRNVPRVFNSEKKTFLPLLHRTITNVCIPSQYEAREPLTCSMIMLDDVFMFFSKKKSFSSCSVVFIIPYSPAVMMIKSL